jgi:hypothetical protein
MKNSTNREMQNNGMSCRSLTTCLKLLIACIVMTAVIGLAVPYAGAAEDIAKFSRVEGKVDVLRAGSLPGIAAKTGDAIFEKDIIRTKSDSTAEILFSDGAVLKVSPRSRLDISEYVTAEKGNRVLNLPRGKAQAIVPARVANNLDSTSKAGRFEIRTPNAVAGVRGTCYSVAFGRNITSVFSIDKPECSEPGTVYLFNIMDPSSITNLAPGTMSTVTSNSSPSIPKTIGPGAGAGAPGGLSAPGVPAVVVPPPPPPLIPGSTKQGNFERIE